MFVRIWSNRGPISLLVQMQNGAATLEDRLLVSYKTEHTCTIGSNIPWHVPQRIENYQHKRLTMNVSKVLFMIGQT